MRTFTVRELDRQPGVVLEACDAEGAVRIRRRDGRSYLIKPEDGAERIIRWPDFQSRIRKIFGDYQLSEAQTREFDHWLAGE